MLVLFCKRVNLQLYLLFHTQINIQQLYYNLLPKHHQAEEWANYVLEGLAILPQ